MTQPRSPSTLLSRTTIVLILAAIYAVLALYDVYVDLHDPYPRIDAEGVANLLFLLGIIAGGKTTAASRSNVPQRKHWSYVLEIDCLLLSIGLIGYALYYRLILH